jgi:contact-dependent growth inhibition (CDI) system CdiI-like immunity protein
VFNLTLFPLPEIHDDASFFRGTITLGDFTEEFLAASWLWDADRYKRQWRAAAQELVAERDRSAFITSFIHPDAHHNVIWPAWRVGRLVYIQNHLMVRDTLTSVLDVDHIYRFVGARRTTSEGDEPISEWVVTLDDVAAFAA